MKNFFQMPADIHFGEIAGVAVNSKGHIFVFSRGNSTGPSYMATAAQLLEFDQNGKFVREIGKNLYAWSYAHAVRIDKQDNIWVVDKGSDMILKMNPAGPRRMGVRPQGRVVAFRCAARLRVARCAASSKRAGVAVTRPQNNNPRNPVPVHRDNVFNQPTDVAWDSQGNSYFTRRLRQLAGRQGERARRVGGQLGLARQRPRSVRHAARRGGLAERRDLCRRSRQPPHPGARP